MQLELNAELATRYKSKSQMARVVTEDWTARNLFCAACDATSLVQRDANTRAVDFICRGCGAGYQLKSGTRLGQRIPDAGYEAMIAAIRSDHVPNLLLMHYVPQWRVRNLIVIPPFCFTEAVIERRKPLGATARRAGWVGCNIQLGAIPPEGRISIVREGIPADPS